MWFHCNECQGFWERHFKKPKKTNLGRKRNVAEICNDNDDNEENEDNGSPEFDKDSEISESWKGRLWEYMSVESTIKWATGINTS